MKKAVLIVGPRHVGKTAIINKFLKIKLGITPKAYYFWNNTGYILSQSIEEGNKSVATIANKSKNYKFVILASRPEHEKISKKKIIINELEKLHFNVTVIELQKKWRDEKDLMEYYEYKSCEIFNIVKKCEI